MTAQGPNRPDATSSQRTNARLAAMLIAAAWAGALSLAMAANARVSPGAEPADIRPRAPSGQAVDLEPWCEAPSRRLASWPSAPPRALLEAFVVDHLAREGVPRPRRVTAELVATSLRHDVDPLLIVSLMEVESGYRPGARSSAGALGLLQVRPATAREVAEHRGLRWSGPAQLFVPEVNVQLGILYLADLLDQFGDVEHALAAYNRGPSAVTRLLSEGGPVPRDFAERVSRAYQELRLEAQANLLTESKPSLLAADRRREPWIES